MSREMKFRAWDKQQQRMIVVPSLHFGEDGSGRTVILQDKTQEGYARLLVMGENAELMQYTGLHDDSGKEVYEGDIVRFEGYVVTEVLYYPCGFCFKNSDETYGYDEVIDDSIEVIGNIYEHPGLVKS